MGPLSQSPYSQQRRGASDAMLGLNQTLFDRGLQYRQGINDRARRDLQRDQKYAAYGAGVGGLANILSMIPGQPPPQIPGYNIGAGGKVTLQGGYGGAPPDDEIRRMLGRR